MLNPRNYTDKQINDTLRIKNGTRKVSFRYDLLDRNDIKIGTLDGITGKVSYGEFRAIKRSATFSLNEYLQKEINYLSDEIQPWFVLHMPDDGTVEWPLGIFLLESPNRNVNRKISSREIGAYDKTIIIEEDKFMERYFIAAGAKYTDEVEKILAISGITRMEIVSSPLELPTDKEFPVGTKVKDAINELLTAINYTSINVDEQGYMYAAPYIDPSLRPITQSYSADKDSIILPRFTESLDIAGRANVFIRVARNIENSTELVATYVNNSLLSPISTVNRGRRIVDYDEVSDIANKVTLDDYVKRIAIENTSAYTHLSFGTVLMPSHGSADALYLNIPDLFDSAVKFSETSWDMDLRFDGVMQHEARKVMAL